MDPPVFQHKLLILIWFVMLLTPIRVEAYYRRNAVGWTKFFDAIVVEVPENNDQNEGSLPGVDSVNINDPSGVPASFCHYIGYYYNPPYYSERLRSKASTEYKYPSTTYTSFMIREDYPKSRIVIGYKAS